MRRQRDPHPATPAVKPVDLYVLLALRGGARHGYGLVRDVEEQSGGRLRLAPASLYNVLQRLLDWGWIEEDADEESEDPSFSGGPPRRAYLLSELGHSVLDAERVRLREVLGLLDSRPDGTR